MLKSAALATAVTTALAAAAPAAAEPVARIQLADASFSFRFGAPVFVVPEPRPVYREYRDYRGERAYRRAVREERV
ncbi:MAG: hypothetical protein AAF371_19740 [Pseudomonadota bacterium]